MSDLSRVEQLLRNALGEDIYEVTPQSRVEVLLAQLNELIEGMGGGSVSPEDIATAVAAYLDEHLTNPTSPPVDTSLSISGAAADAKKTGDEISELKEGLTNVISADDVNLLQDLTWEQGSFNDITGAEYSSTIRLRSAEYLDISNYAFMNFAIESGYKYTVYCFDANKSYLVSTSLHTWQTVNYEKKTFASNAKYIRFLVADVNNGTVSDDYANRLTATGVYPITNVIQTLYPDINHYSGIDLGWEIGTLNSANGEEIPGTTRARSRRILVGKGTVVSLSDTTNFKHLLYQYDTDGTYISAGQWVTDDFAITEDRIIRILLCYSDNRTITDETLAVIASKENIDYGIPFSDMVQESASIYTIPENIEKKSEATILKQKKTSAEAYGECDLKMMFFTDVHGDARRTRRMKDLVNNWGTDFFDVAVCGGDITVNLETESITWYENAVSGLSVPLLNVIGNHDAWNGSGGSKAEKTDVYAKFIAPFVSESGIIQPTGASENGYNYYYKDIGVVRIIVIDCMYWDATQLSWFESVLADAKTNSKSVLCVSHAAFPLANMTKVDCLWSKSGVNTDGTRLNIQAASAVKDYIDADGSFIAWIVGHQHGDYVHQLPDYNNQFVVNLASFAQRAGWLLKNTDESAYNYDCLTYIAVDVTNSIIKFMRIGANIDIYGTQYHGLVLDYANNQLISSY